MKTRKYIVLKKNLMDKLIKEHEEFYIGTKILNLNGNKSVVKKEYIDFMILQFNNSIELIIADVNSHLFKYNDLIDVTDNQYFQVSNIINNLIINSNIIIEGADGVGKTTIAKELANSGIIAQDREIEFITKKMRKDINEKERLDSVSNYLEYNPDKKVVFLYMSDEKELKNRVSDRGIKSIYDSGTLEYNFLYYETYQKLSNYNNLYLIDCYGKDISNVLNELKSIVNVKGEKCNIIK